MVTDCKLAYDGVKQAMRMETERPIAVRQAITACRNGGTVSLPGVYGGFMDKFPIGIADEPLNDNSSTGQTHVQRYIATVA